MTSQKFDGYTPIDHALPRLEPVVWAMCWTGVLLGYSTASVQAYYHPYNLVLSLVIGWVLYVLVCARSWYRVWRIR